MGSWLAMVGGRVAHSSTRLLGAAIESMGSAPRGQFHRSRTQSNVCVSCTGLDELGDKLGSRTDP